MQIIPHITDEIKRCIKKVSKEKDVDVTIVEIGGTVGDIESLPFPGELSARCAGNWASLMRWDIHVTLLPYIKSAGEQKRSPRSTASDVCGRSVSRRIFCCAARKGISVKSSGTRSRFLQRGPRRGREAPDVKYIYEVPLSFRKGNLDDLILKKIGHLKSGERPEGFGESLVINRLKQSSA